MTPPTAVLMPDRYRDLRQRVVTVFDTALAQTTTADPLNLFRNELQAQRERLGQPMRVAVVGLIKAGKSTLINGLLGERLVATGSVETTFNVNWLRHGGPPRIQLHFKDDRAPEDLPFDDLDSVTRRRSQDMDRLLAIRHVEIRHPNPVLREHEIIDTPGLESYYQQDSENTRAFLELHGKELGDATEQHASQADAVLYLFAQGVRQRDQSALEQFQGATLRFANPLNSIGVLTKVDTYWPADSDPMRAGQGIADRLMGRPRVRRLFFAIRPICGLLAEGAGTLDGLQIDDLKRLAQLPEDRLARLFTDVRRFADRVYPDIPVGPARRRPLLERLGLYGVERACHFLRRGGHPERLTERLRQASGLSDLKHLIVRHFGHRSDLIKLQNALGRIETVYFRERRKHEGDPSTMRALESAWGLFERLQMTEPTLAELSALRSLYHGQLSFESWELRQIQEILGELGESWPARLGLEPSARREDLVIEARQRLEHWRQRSNERLTLGGPSLAAARTIVRALEGIVHAHSEKALHDSRLQA